MRNPWEPHSVLVDSGASLAIVDRDDEHHHEAVAIQQQLFRTRPQLFLTNFLVDEPYTLLLTRAGYRVALQFLDSTESNTMTVLPVSPADEREAKQLLRRYTDKRFSYTDATSFVIMQRFGVEAAFTFDENFTQFGLRVLAP